MWTVLLLRNPAPEKELVGERARSFHPERYSHKKQEAVGSFQAEDVQPQHCTPQGQT